MKALSPLLLPLLAFCQLLVAIDYNIVLVALPDIGRGLNLGGGAQQWAVTSYALAVGGGLLLGGRLADTRGPRRTLLVGLSMYALGSLLAALSGGFSILVIGRAIQGLGGALTIPAVLALIGISFPDGPPRHRALAVWSAAGAVGLAIGSALGGVLTSGLGWPSVFLINLPLVALAFAGTVVAIPADERRTGGSLDLPGALLAAIAAVALVLAFSEGPLVGWLDPVTLVAFVSGVVLTVGFVLRERAAKTPLLPLAVFRGSTLTPALIVMLLFLGSIGSSYVVFTLYFQQVLHVSPLLTGLAYLPWGLVAVGGSKLAEFGLGRLEIRGALLVSLGIGAIGTGLLAVALNPSIPLVVPILATVVLGAGQAMGFASLYAAAVADVDPQAHGVASALMSTVQQLGTALGIAVLGGIAVAIGAGGGERSQAAGLQVATAIGAIVVALALAVAAFVGRSGATATRVQGGV